MSITCGKPILFQFSVESKQIKQHLTTEMLVLYIANNRGNIEWKLYLQIVCLCFFPCPLEPVDLSVNKIYFTQTNVLKLFLKKKH